jgi:dihydroorotase-like cyclic amidohydrolase
MADDFASGTHSAAFDGSTTVLPFCIQEKGQSLRSAVTYHAKADQQCYTDYGFHLIVSEPSPQVLGQELPALGRLLLVQGVHDLRGAGADACVAGTLTVTLTAASGVM